MPNVDGVGEKQSAKVVKHLTWVHYLIVITIVSFFLLCAASGFYLPSYAGEYPSLISIAYIAASSILRSLPCLKNGQESGESSHDIRCRS